MFPGYEEDIAEAEIVEVFGLRDDLWNTQSGSQNWIIPGKSAVLAVIYTLVGEVEWGEESHGFAEVAAGKDLALLGHFLQFSVASSFQQFPKAPHEWSGGFHEGIELVSKTHAGLVVAGCNFVKSFPKNGIASQVESCWSDVRYGKCDERPYSSCLLYTSPSPRD